MVVCGIHYIKVFDVVNFTLSQTFFENSRVKSFQTNLFSINKIRFFLNCSAECALYPSCASMDPHLLKRCLEVFTFMKRINVSYLSYSSLLVPRAENVFF